MSFGRQLPLVIRADDRSNQRNRKGVAQCTTLPLAFDLQARMIRASDEVPSNTGVAGYVYACPQAIGQRLCCFLVVGVRQLQADLTSGRPWAYDDFVMQEIKGVVQWLFLIAVTPRKARTFTLHTDPYSISKVWYLARRHLNPPDRASVLCRYERSHVPTPDRAQSPLQMDLGCRVVYTDSYIRHGTLTPLALLGTAGGNMQHDRGVHRRRHLQCEVVDPGSRSPVDRRESQALLLSSFRYPTQPRPFTLLVSRGKAESE